MVIKIITRHAVANYGSILQAYATQKIFKNIGYDSEIINYIRYDEQGISISDTMLRRNKQWNKNKLRRIVYRILQTPIYTTTFKKFEKYRQKLLHESNQIYHSEGDLKNLPIADIYCTGSDQVWGPVGNVQFDPVYFLSFAPKSKKCISFASSFGNDSVPKCLQKELSNLLSRYSSISVREHSAVSFLDSIGINAKLMLDPTLMLGRDEWKKICSHKITRKNYILIYQLHPNNQLEKYADAFAKSIGKPLIRISISWLYRFKNGNFVFMPSPQEFLSYFANCEYVITDSFHATVFSIIFRKKFVDFLPQGAGGRISDLLSMLDLRDRILFDCSDLKKQLEPIDYNVVDDKLEKLRKICLQNLREMVEN